MRNGIIKAATGLGTALAAITPAGRCPACTATAAGVAGSASLSSLSSALWFVPGIGIFLLLGLGGAILSARTHRQWGAVWLTVAGSGLLLAGRITSQTTLLWTAGVLLMAGLLLDWRWKRKKTATRLVQIGRIT